MVSSSQRLSRLEHSHPTLFTCPSCLSRHRLLSVHRCTPGPHTGQHTAGPQ
ncbi:unnamed protein product [Gulo gulo]|uniref:Uncharacterized protein n=1 Tax=Gulo gulo TaxID=48420 RepID=A0A9X9PT40_GULGU|nr:unnamed protein product [Gulo gulo]